MQSSSFTIEKVNLIKKSTNNQIKFEIMKYYIKQI